jgi:[protein-PII] uridylyltransferase
LKLIRARLHVIAGRREDRLVFDLQTAVADSFGYRGLGGQRASEMLMRRYYWAAKAVTQLNQILMLNIEERVDGSQDAPMRPINDKFLERAGMLEVVSDDLYQRDPHAILETFLVYQQTVGPKGLSARTLRALYNARDLMDAKFRHDPVNRATFMKILQEHEGQTHAFRLMNQTSVLGRYLWVFRRIVGQMQHDLFHVYTVDQHIIMVLRNVRRFFIPEHAHEYAFCSQLASTFDRPWVLYIAALFHDVAKGRGGDHSELGAREARRFCRDHKVPAEDAKLIEFLVVAHLTMSRIAQKEDLSDPDVIETFAKMVGNERTLTALYLLTVADIRGTSPKVWNAWKGKLLEDLYRLTLRALGGARPNMDAEVEARKLEARHMLNLASLPIGVEQALWKTLEISYFARHDAGDIAWHTRSLHLHVASTRPVVQARLSPLGEGLQVLVYAPDQPDLFARICGYFDGAGFNILDAKVHTTRKGYALDTFQVNSPSLEQHYRDLISYVETQLALALAQTGALPEPGRGRISRRVKSFPITPRVTLRPDERAQRWLLGVSASDRSGLLYSIARVLARHQINLQLAKITTLGERVEDTFLIDGPALQQNRTQLQIESELLDALAP